MLNRVLSLLSSYSYGFKLNGVMNDLSGVHNHDVFFEETDLPGSFEAEDCTQLGNMSPFIREHIDSCCNQRKFSQIASVFCGFLFR